MAYPWSHSIIHVLNIDKDLFIIPAVIHSSLKGASAKGTLRHGLEILTKLLI